MDNKDQYKNDLSILSLEIESKISKREIEECFILIDLMISKAKLSNSIFYLGKANGYKGFLYYGLNETKKAIKFFEIAYEYYFKDIDSFFNEIKQICNSLGVLYKNLGELKKAINILIVSIEISEKYSIQNSISYNNIGLIYYSQNEFKKALFYYNKAVEIENSSINQNRISIIKYLINIANLYVKLDDFENAEKIYQKTFKFCQNSDEYELLIINLKGLALIMLNNKDYKNAEVYLLKAKIVSEENDYNVYLLDILLYLSDLYCKTKRFDLQISSLNYAYKIALESYPGKELLVLEELHDYYYNSGNIEKAYETLKNIYILNNKTIQKEKDDKILELQEKFETEQKDKLIKQEQAFNQTLQEKNRELAALNEDLAQFNYGVSHDLKEPIRLVRGRLSHMHVKSFHKLEPEEQSSLETSLAAAERMERMLEDLHKFSSLGSNLKNLQQVNLNEVLAIVQADLQERIRANEALVEVEKLPNLLGYKNMFVQLFQNLINNALKFRRLEVTPHIKISYKTDEDWHIIHVQDNGVGIKKENQEQVFKLFKRLQETEAREGSGVGLSIVQKIVKKMQGEISLASVYGTGTCFILKFPKK